MTTTPSTTETTADAALKARHRAIWASGDYPKLADELIPMLGPALLDALGDIAGQRLLDVAAGSGNVAIPAALRGAEVVASDLVPELLEAGEERALARGAGLDWVVGDAERLPFADASFDVLTSSVGVMFAPHHQRAADEVVRVVRPGGRIGLLSWTPAGFIGQLFATMSRHLPPAAPGAQAPPLWGDVEHVRALLGERAEIVSTAVGHARIGLLRGVGQFRHYFSSHYGPTIAALAQLADAPAERAALEADLDALAAAHTDADGMSWEYSIVVGRRT